MGKGIPVLLGDKIPLQAQETSRDATKVVRVNLINLVTGATIQAGILLDNSGDGLYTNNDIIMPNIDHILAQYFVFDSDGTTPNTTGDQAVTDVFALAESSAEVRITDAVIQGQVKDENLLDGIVLEDENILGATQKDDILGTLTEEDNDIDGGVSPDEIGASLED